MGKTLFFLLITTVPLQLFPQQNTLTNQRASQFINAMLNDSDSLETFVLSEELSLSKRLGITYEGVKNKFLISYEIPNEILPQIKNGKADYKMDIESLDDQYSILHFEVPANNYKAKYYFKDRYLVSPPYYYYKDWQKIESKHFIFYVSKPEYFNQYSIDKLEDFIESIFTKLEFIKDEIKTLEKEKIIYILCKDENDIEQLTGYKARGMCNLAYDYLITTYNCHYHELLHLLINFKLKNLPLYTHPFLQEGFAVALGGRGGKEPGVILNLGCFIEKSGFLNYKDLLDINNYKNNDVSLSYPLSGLYNKFLIENLSIDDYLELYLKYSSSNNITSTISTSDLPAEEDWLNFLKEYPDNEKIKFDLKESDFEKLIKDSLFTISQKDNYYLVNTMRNLLFSAFDKDKTYQSKIFNELFSIDIYNGEKYLVRVNNTEIAVYNLYTNNLIANYASGFTIDMKPVPKENGYFQFLLNKNLFDEDLTDLQIKIMENQ